MDILGAFLNGFEDYYLKLTLDIILGINDSPIPDELESYSEAVGQAVPLVSVNVPDTVPFNQITQEYMEESKVSYYGNSNSLESILDSLNSKIEDARNAQEELNNARYEIDDAIGEVDQYIDDLEGLISSLENVPELDLRIEVDVTFDSSSN